MGGGPLNRWQEVGCGKYCFECPPTPEQARLALFRCDEIASSCDNDLGDHPGGLRALIQRPDLLRLFRSPNPGLAGAGDFGPDPTDVVGQDWTVTEHDRALLAEVRYRTAGSLRQRWLSFSEGRGLPAGLLACLPEQIYGLATNSAALL